MPNPFQKKTVKDCALCSKSFTAEWARQSYCPPCQEVRKSTLRLQGIRKTKQSKASAYAEIVAKSEEGKTRLCGAFERPDCEWTVSFKVPYTNSASKNRRWSMMRGGAGVFIPANVLNYTSLIISEAKKALAGRKVYENKVWVSFFVQKPDHKSDAVNVVDTFCDALKTAIGVDDRWFSIGLVDWEIKKSDPQVFVKIGQQNCYDARACSHCGGIYPLDQFNKNKTNKLGVARECKECKAVVSAKRKKIKK